MTTHSPSPGTAEPPKQSKRTLSEIVSAMLGALDDAGGEVTAAVDELELQLEDKVQAYRAVMLQLEGEAKAFAELAASYKAREETRKNQITGLKFRLDAALKAVGVDSLRTKTCTVYYQGSTRVEIPDEAAFVESAEDRFVEVKQYPKRDELKKALDAGEQVEGAHLLKSKHLRFR
jgi:hypothetical protein